MQPGCSKHATEEEVVSEKALERPPENQQVETMNVLESPSANLLSSSREKDKGQIDARTGKIKVLGNSPLHCYHCHHLRHSYSRRRVEGTSEGGHRHHHHHRYSRSHHGRCNNPPNVNSNRTMHSCSMDSRETAGGNLNSSFRAGSSDEEGQRESPHFRKRHSSRRGQRNASSKIDRKSGRDSILDKSSPSSLPAAPVIVIDMMELPTASSQEASPSLHNSTNSLNRRFLESTSAMSVSAYVDSAPGTTTSVDRQALDAGGIDEYADDQTQVSTFQEGSGPLKDGVPCWCCAYTFTLANDEIEAQNGQCLHSGSRKQRKRQQLRHSLVHLGERQSEQTRYEEEDAEVGDYTNVNNLQDGEDRKKELASSSQHPPMGQPLRPVSTYWDRIFARPHAVAPHLAPFVRVPLKDLFWSFVASFIGISLLAVVSVYALPLLHDQYTAIIASFGASAVLVFASIGSPLAQPRNLVVGNTMSAFIGVTCRKFFVWISPGNPSSVHWVSGPLAVSMSITAMQVTHTVHPPGGATALIATIGGEQIYHLGYIYVLLPVFTGSCLMLLVALAVNNIQRQYPKHYWAPPPPPLTATALLPASPQELMAAVLESDVDEDKKGRRGGRTAFCEKTEGKKVSASQSRHCCGSPSFSSHSESSPSVSGESASSCDECVGEDRRSYHSLPSFSSSSRLTMHHRRASTKQHSSEEEETQGKAKSNMKVVRRYGRGRGGQRHRRRHVHYASRQQNGNDESHYRSYQSPLSSVRSPLDSSVALPTLSPSPLALPTRSLPNVP